MAEALKERNSDEVKPTPVPQPEVPPAPPTLPRPRPDRWKKVKAALAELKTWATKAVAPVVGRAALGWAVVLRFGCRIIEIAPDLVVQAGLVVPDRKEIVTAPVEDRLSDLGLASHGIDGHNGSF